MDNGMLGENHHKVNLIEGESILLNRNVDPKVDHILHCLIEYIHPRQAIAIGQSWCAL